MLSEQTKKKILEFFATIGNDLKNINEYKSQINTLSSLYSISAFNIVDKQQKNFIVPEDLQAFNIIMSINSSLQEAKLLFLLFYKSYKINFNDYLNYLSPYFNCDKTINTSFTIKYNLNILIKKQLELIKNIFIYVTLLEQRYDFTLKDMFLFIGLNKYFFLEEK